MKHMAWAVLILMTIISSITAMDMKFQRDNAERDLQKARHALIEAVALNEGARQVCGEGYLEGGIYGIAVYPCNELMQAFRDYARGK